MKYLVTGGAGFIGSHLTDELIKQGHEVVILDNLSTGKKENINSKAKFVKADITKLEEIKPHFVGIDGVFHTAALPRVQLSIEKPAETNEVNVNGTLNVLIAAKDAGVKRFVYSSSSSIYGNAETIPVRENFKSAPVSPYGLQKYVGEEYTRVFAAVYKMETVSLRYFNVYGPRMSESGAYLSVIRTFLNQKKTGESLTIYGDGEQTRDFTHVRDVVEANLLAMASPKVGKGEAINIGVGKRCSVNYVATLIGGERKYFPARMEIKHNEADNSLAKKLLAWEPKEKLDESIKEL